MNTYFLDTGVLVGYAHNLETDIPSSFLDSHAPQASKLLEGKHWFFMAEHSRNELNNLRKRRKKCFIRLLDLFKKPPQPREHYLKEKEEKWVLQAYSRLETSTLAPEKIIVSLTRCAHQIHSRFEVAKKKINDWYDTYEEEAYAQLCEQIPNDSDAKIYACAQKLFVECEPEMIFITTDYTDFEVLKQEGSKATITYLKDLVF